MRKLINNTDVIRNIVFLLGITSLALTGYSFLGVVHAQTARESCLALKQANNTIDCDSTGSLADSSEVQSIIRSIVSVLSILVGVVSVIMIIIGGFRYVISNGDSNSLKSAKDTILYAIIGLVIVLFAQVIVRFVLKKATTPVPDKTQSASQDAKDKN